MAVMTPAPGADPAFAGAAIVVEAARDCHGKVAGRGLDAARKRDYIC
jgi:hypothetical protein